MGMLEGVYDDYVRTFYYISQTLQDRGLACIITNNQFINRNTFI